MKKLIILVSLCLLAACSQIKPQDQEIEYIGPIFILPADDSRNSISSVFINQTCSGDRLTSEITVVFSDEDHPNGLIDLLYDGYRQMKYGRSADVETFTIHSQHGVIEKIDFKHVYAADQTFYFAQVQHYDATPAGSTFEYEGNRPVIYINTWNHMFSETDNNPALQKLIIRTYPTYPGSRMDVEALF